jgi:hypothetical protein
MVEHLSKDITFTHAGSILICMSICAKFLSLLAWLVKICVLKNLVNSLHLIQFVGNIYIYSVLDLLVYHLGVSDMED